MTDLRHHDVVNCYRLVLGRDPESDGVVEEKLAQPKVGLLKDFFSSPEFSEGVLRAIAEERAVLTSHRAPPTKDIKTWAADFLPLSPATVERLSAAKTWNAIYHALFADARFAEDVLSGTALMENGLFVPALAARVELEAASQIEGRVELITPHEIRGWALDSVDPDRRLCVELWIDDVFRAAVALDRYRPELQTQFGGSGMFGFVMARPMDAEGAGPVRAELRESVSGTVIETVSLPPQGSPPIDVAVALRRELKEVRALLARIEHRLPDLQEAYSFSLDLYGDYYETYYAPAHSALSRGAPLADMTVVVDARAATPAVLRRALESVGRQARAPRYVVVAHGGGDLRIETEQELAAWRGRFEDAQSPRAVTAASDWAAMIAAAAEATPADHLLFMGADTRLAPDACGLLDEALGRGAGLAYADSDAIAVRADGSVERHASPAFRTDFDPDVFLQSGDLGPVLGLTRRFLDALRAQAPAPAGWYDLLLPRIARPELGDIRHLPRVLSHALEPAQPFVPEAHEEALARHLSRHSPGTRAAVYRDPLCTGSPSFLRVRHPLPQGARAAVIVPTRDRLDLLEPCLTSLVATAAENRVAFEIIVVENQSREPATFAFVERLAQTQPVRLLPHDGVFNWAAMNNRAAAQTDADVLIFLNNDTAVLSPDWCDELCVQALRPGVGAVGARLLYRDGTIQHAGAVVGGLHAFSAHEGVGAPVQDPGYGCRHALLRQVSAVTGACMAIGRSVFERFGGFDGLSLPVESNDVDFCLRARRAGFAILYDPYCTFYHYESKSRGFNVDPERWARAEAAGALMRERWGEAFRDDPFYNPHFDRVSAPLTRLRPPLRLR